MFEEKREAILKLADEIYFNRKGRKPAQSKNEVQLDESNAKKKKDTSASTRLGNELKLIFGTHFKKVLKNETQTPDKKTRGKKTTGYKYVADEKLDALLSKSNHATRLAQIHENNECDEKYKTWLKNNSPPEQRPKRTRSVVYTPSPSKKPRPEKCQVPQVVQVVEENIAFWKVRSDTEHTMER